MRTYLPHFPGFYHSDLSALIDWEDEQREENGTPAISDYKAAFLALSQVWIEALNDELGTAFEFAELWSPREYNFDTDKLYVTITPTDVEKLRQYHGSAELGRIIAEELKPRSGFAPFYSDDPTDDEWTQPIEDWDEPQLSLLIQAMMEAEMETERLPGLLLSGRFDYKFTEALCNL
jgi:hypothetical protein